MASARTDSRPGADRVTALRPAGVRMMERIALGALTMILSVNTIETIVILTVVAASILFEAWFFFFAKTVVPG